MAYTTDGSDPTFDVSGNISNGSLYLGSLTTPNNAVTSYEFIARDVAGNTSAIQSVAFTVGSIPPSGLRSDFGYSPKCVKISAGTQVIFSAPPVHPIKGGDVADYPTTTSVPPMNIPDFTSAALTFSNPGTYPYYCSVHGPASLGTEVRSLSCLSKSAPVCMRSYSL